MIRQLIPSENEEDLELMKKNYTAMVNEPDNLRWLNHTFMPFDESLMENWYSR